jgi:hypothetical protein
MYVYCRSQRLRDVRHELSSPARTLVSWVRIPLKAWMSAYVYSVFVLCVGSGLTTGLSPVQGVVPAVYRIKKLKKRPRPNKGLYSHRWMDGWIRYIRCILHSLSAAVYNRRAGARERTAQSKSSGQCNLITYNCCNARNPMSTDL